MNADLSLSQSLGGLRIANPDDPELASPTTSPPPESNARETTQSSASSSYNTAGYLPSHASDAEDHPSAGTLGFDPSTYAVSESAPATYASPPQRAPSSPHSRHGLPPASSRNLNHRKSMPLDHQGQQAAQFPYHHPPVSHARPMSGMYMQPNTSSSSQYSYRYRDDMGSSDGDSAAYTRGPSRSTRPPQSGVGRQSSRSYATPPEYADQPVRRTSSQRVRPPGGTSAPAYEGSAPFTGNAPIPRTADEWKDRGAAVLAKTEVDSSGQPQTRMIKKGVKDFNFGRTLGEGSYSTVLAATDRQNLKEYAIKVLDKRHIIKEKKVKYVNIERDTLNRLTEHPGVVRLYYTFQDERSLYFVLDLATGGELLGVWKKLGSFDVECTRFYGAQILDTIAYMHSRGVIHRDLKPENVLLDREGHVRITDFGTAKILPEPKRRSASGPTPGDPSDGADSDRAISFVGTAEYVSPELLRDNNACKASDLWAFGCIVYQLLAGRPPFKAGNEFLTFQKILQMDYSFPDGFPEVARDLVERLLVPDPAKRLPVDHIKNHEFFDGIQWGKGLWKQKPPKLRAYVPPPAAPIKLNGTSRSARAPISSNTGGGGALSASAAATALATHPPSQTPGPPPVTTRPHLSKITELPPPSQLDIDWSPVLVHSNERILKLGNLIVSTGSPTSSPNSRVTDAATGGEKSKFLGLFSSNTTKKRERLVLITSRARLIVAAAGGNEKKAKMDVDCLQAGTSWKSFMDAKGLTGWCLETREKHYTFEDPRATVLDPAGSKYSTQEWLDSMEQARQLAISINAVSGSYSDGSVLSPAIESSATSPSDSIGADGIGPLGGLEGGQRHNLRQTLRSPSDDGNQFKGRKRFSKRHSKGGLAAVF